MAAYALERDRYPVMVIRTLVDRPQTEDEVTELLALGDQLIAGGRPYVLLYVTTPNGTLSAHQRRRYADWLDENRARLASLNRGTGIVISSAVIRGIATALAWMSPFPMVTHYYATEAEAFAWCVERARQQGLERREALG